MPTWDVSIRRIWQVIGVLVFLGAIVGIGVWLVRNGGTLIASTPSRENALPTLVIVGVLVIVVSLGMLSVVFSFRNMTDPKQALGLPDGSVRAVVALLLVVLFAVLSISLYTSLSQGSVDAISNLSAAQKDDIVKKFSGDIVAVSDPPVDPATTWTVWRRAPSNKTSEDFAKQLLVMIGTLVTAVASFYFGANTVASAQASSRSADSAKPVISGIDPNPIAKDALKDVKLTGENLGSVKAVNLSNGGSIVPAQNVSSNPGTVTFKAQLQSGNWDITVIEVNGTQTKASVQLKAE